MSMSKADRFGFGSLYGPKDANAGLPPPPTNTKTLAPEELEKAVERLSHQRAKKIEDGPLLPAIVKPKAEIDQTIDRLYTRAIQAQQNQKLEPPKSGNKLDQQQMEESVNRLYVQNGKTERLSRLREKYYSGVYNTNPKTRTLSPSEQADQVKRMVQESRAREEEKQRKLYEKYIQSTEPPKKRLPADQIAAATQRLFRKD